MDLSINRQQSNQVFKISNNILKRHFKMTRNQRMMEESKVLLYSSIPKQRNVRIFIVSKLLVLRAVAVILFIYKNIKVKIYLNSYCSKLVRKIKSEICCKLLECMVYLKKLKNSKIAAHKNGIFKIS